MTWPELGRLLSKMESYPSANFLAAAWFREQKPKPIAEQVSSFGITTKKGKVKKRGDISGRDRSKANP